MIMISKFGKNHVNLFSKIKCSKMSNWRIYLNCRVNLNRFICKSPEINHLKYTLSVLGEWLKFILKQKLSYLLTDPDVENILMRQLIQFTS